MGILKMLNGRGTPSLMRGLSKAASHALKTPMGHSVANAYRKVDGLTQTIAENYRSMDKATGGLLGEGVSAGVSLIPGGSAALNYGRKAYAAKRTLDASLKRARAETKSNMSRSRKRLR